MSTIARNTVFALLVALVVGPARADQYWVAYEGNDFPENEGWERVYGDENGPGQGGSNRSIEDGRLVLDSTRNHLIYDSYRVDRLIDPQSDEMFVAEWRVDIGIAIGPLPDQYLVVATDRTRLLMLGLDGDSIRSIREGWDLPYGDPGFHTYRIESTDMVGYRLSIDGVLMIDGFFDSQTLAHSFVAFGDNSAGGGIVSSAAWDYVRFGVVPEPSAGLLGACGLLRLAAFLRRRL